MPDRLDDLAPVEGEGGADQELAEKEAGVRIAVTEVLFSMLMYRGNIQEDAKIGRAEGKQDRDKILHLLGQLTNAGRGLSAARVRELKSQAIESFQIGAGADDISRSNNTKENFDFLKRMVLGEVA